MAEKKFRGKIFDDPWESLSKGDREVMQTLWEGYLQESLQVSPKGGRFKIIRKQIEDAAGYREIFQNWNTLEPPARSVAWRRLMTTARTKLSALGQECARCGECCERSSPTLLTRDLGLFQQDVLTWNEVYTLRAGEQAADREAQVVTLAGERLKVRETPGAHQCWFYQAATRKCRIYDQRPEQCRRQECWSEPAAPPAPEEFLTRRDLLAGAPEILEIITAHEQRCDLKKLIQALADVADGQEEAGDALFDALHFDQSLRQMLQKEWELSANAVEFLLGRPLPEFLKGLGVKAIPTLEGSFRLQPK
jgi:Fe-S-cluster containining protein